MPSLSVRRSGILSSNYSVSNRSTCLTTLYAGPESKSEFEVEGSKYQMIRESRIGDFVLSGPTGEICRATKPSARFRSFTFVYQNDTFTLEASSTFVENFELKQADKIVGTIHAKGFFTTHGKIDFPERLPLPVQFFIIWLAVLMWECADDAASSAQG